MAIPKFFHNSKQFVENETIVLSEEEARHASMARRLQVGSDVVLLNGQGMTAKGRFLDLNKRSATVVVDQVAQHSAPDRKIRIASAIPKGDRQKVMIDMLTQCAVVEFIPLECEFSVVQANSKLIQKWQRIVIEACKQSGNPFAMQIRQPIAVNDLILADVWQQSQVLRAEQRSETSKVLEATIESKMKKTDILVVIGPEGGFSEAEIASFDSGGIDKISLSAHILRTETAAIAAAVRLCNV